MNLKEFADWYRRPDQAPHREAMLIPPVLLNREQLTLITDALRLADTNNAQSEDRSSVLMAEQRPLEFKDTAGALLALRTRDFSLPIAIVGPAPSIHAMREAEITLNDVELRWQICIPQKRKTTTISVDRYGKVHLVGVQGPSNYSFGTEKTFVSDGTSMKLNWYVSDTPDFAIVCLDCSPRISRGQMSALNIHFAK
ncbi:hypothetical protein A2363_05185 [Candidatus Gottesmanbacteria bacterium RIFOXYB1_FULL_47_11]|uniref:Uncharacterized protein n=1 Tax=Candidatus Gottesmanbacteria bacterium RIFOXYB1_FULL_47_11 TaxID=1798401 RepID=A0A1F6BFD1_9BACT|nr:MAG: hypothetical protein A2363_05185 [Candidatus Gottesmanbacteria bacterium RIFOXYB1_FULL_47_11]